MKSKRILTFLSWAGITIAVLGLLASIFEFEGVKALIGTIFVAAAFAIPGVAWLRYEQLDAKARTEAEESAQYEQFLTAEDKALLGSGLNQGPRLAKRRWGPIWLACLAALVIGGSLLPNPEEASKSGVSGTNGVFYSDCDAARDAGAAPINRGEPGYRPDLDSDNDGIACED